MLAALLDNFGISSDNVPRSRIIAQIAPEKPGDKDPAVPTVRRRPQTPGTLFSRINATVQVQNLARKV
jgi:hypothetical protein